MDVNVFYILTLVKINMIDEIILGIFQDENTHSIFVGFIFVVHSYMIVPATDGNSSLRKNNYAAQ